MFSKILIANRGEIACRIIKTAKRMGIKTVAVYSDADANAQHVLLADEAFHIGPSAASSSYLVAEKIIQAALRSHAQAIHPGYGFLSENAEFAKICAQNNIVFIGPPSSAIEAMGSKSAAKTIMEKAGVPLVPGYHGDHQSASVLRQAAEEISYPVLLKAVAGGGGKGMRQVWNAGEFDQALSEAKSESLASFGNDDMLVEKYLTQPRHIEVQVFCDQHGNGVYLFERDCSIQRRHQKVIEEAPAPNISKQQRSALGDAAVQAAKAIDYEGAGTVEFLFDTDGSFYFMEMNTRLQVEHPITEMITQQDLVEWQLRVANGEPLPLAQDELFIHGHAIEARVYAEDPNNNFLPTTGTLDTLITPIENRHVRVDSGVVEGDTVTPFYDPMIAKLIIWDEDRNKALRRTAEALRDYRIQGVTTNISFLYDLVSSEPLQNAELDTGFIDKHADLLFKTKELEGNDLIIKLSQAALFLLSENRKSTCTTQSTDPWSSHNGWRMNQANEHLYQIEIADSIYQVHLQQTDHESKFGITIDGQDSIASAELNSFDTDSPNRQFICTVDGHRQNLIVTQADSEQTKQFMLFAEDGATAFTCWRADHGDSQADTAQSAFIAPMNGTIVDVLVKENEQVKQGQVVIMLEAMKMQHTISAPSDGQVKTFFYQPGDLVDGGALLLNFVVDQKN